VCSIVKIASRSLGKREDWTHKKEKKPSTNSLMSPLKIPAQAARPGEPLAASFVLTLIQPTKGTPRPLESDEKLFQT